MLLKKRKREEAEINGSSMADIAFLLLIFFLVTTTINVDTGIGMVLPPAPDDTEPPPIRERNLLKILVNAQGLVMLDDNPSSINEVKDKVMEFVKNPNQDPNLSESPEKAIVSIKTQRESPYSIYIDMLDEVMAAYNELRNEESMRRYGVPFGRLEPDSDARKAITDFYPKKISLAEPDAN